MTVGELIKKLQKQDKDRLVVMASDSEGNSYAPLYSLETGSYGADMFGENSVGLEELIEAIKFVRDNYSLGLRESKEYVEWVWGSGPKPSFLK